MAVRKICAVGGCSDIAVIGAARCDYHEAQRIAQVNEKKALIKKRSVARAGAALYASVWWRRERLRFLARFPLCADCAEVGIDAAATDVDHIEPHRGDLALFRDRGNWRALCKSCHSRKTAREVWHGSRDGGGI